MSAPTVAVIDYQQAEAADFLLPQPSVLASNGWNQLHLEVFEQPKFEIAEHQHTMHAIAYSPISDNFPTTSTGDRWLDGKRCYETRHQGEIAIIPAGITHRCNWDTSVQFVVLAIEPELLQHVGQDWIEHDCIELIPQFMTQPDLLIQGILSTLKAELEFSQSGSALLIDSLKTTLAIHLLRNYCSTQPRLSSYSSGLSQSTLQRVREYIHEHLHQNLKLSDLSAIAQLSPCHFLRLSMENDLRAALKFLKTQPNVNPKHIGVTGFCLGGGLTFFTACRLSGEIAAAAPFYGMVLNEWIDAVKEITVPVLLFFGRRDVFILGDRIQQIEDRFRELDKDYTLKVYPEAGHGFFCNERSDYHPSAAADAWQKLTQFFQQHLIS